MADAVVTRNVYVAAETPLRAPSFAVNDVVGLDDGDAVGVPVVGLDVGAALGLAVGLVVGLDVGDTVRLHVCPMCASLLLQPAVHT